MPNQDKRLLALNNAAINFENTCTLSAFMFFGPAPALLTMSAIFLDHRLHKASGIENAKKKNILRNPTAMSGEIQKLHLGTAILFGFGAYTAYSNNRVGRVIIASGIYLASATPKSGATRLVP